jgi:hypothetical protein
MKSLNGSNFGHSADVRIHLHVNGAILPVAQLGPDFLILRTPIDHPPTKGEIRMSIDGVESRWGIELSEGIISTQRRVGIAHSGHVTI